MYGVYRRRPNTSWYYRRHPPRGSTAQAEPTAVRSRLPILGVG